MTIVQLEQPSRSFNNSDDKGQKLVKQLRGLPSDIARRKCGTWRKLAHLSVVLALMMLVQPTRAWWGSSSNENDENNQSGSNQARSGGAQMFDLGN